MRIWIEKNIKFDGTYRYYVMGENECIGSSKSLLEAKEIFEKAKINYRLPMVEIIEEIEL